MKSCLIGVLYAMCLPAIALGAEPPWLKCRSGTDQEQLACYRATTDEYVKSQQITGNDKLGTAHDWKLDSLWALPAKSSATPTLSDFVQPYKQNYLLFYDAIHNPGAAPASPNPLNNVPPGKALSASEIKFQISIKAPLPIPYLDENRVWLAYTQQSHWQAFNSADSRPFRENNYEPELIYHWDGFDSYPNFRLGNFVPRFLNLTALHQSNGQSLPRSRSWNRLTAQLGSEYKFDDGHSDEHLAVLIRPWWRVTERSAEDDNHDITKYLGYGDIEVDYWCGNQMLSTLLRSRAVQLDWSYALSGHKDAWRLHLQYFDGYGESLIDYNHKLHSLGIGVSLPY